MKTEDIKKMAQAWLQVQEAAKKKKEDEDKESMTHERKEKCAEEMDPVDHKALKGKFKDRKDKDINNDGKVNSSDKYLHNRRKTVSATIKGKNRGEVEVQTSESTVNEISKAMLGRYIKKAKTDVAGQAYQLGAKDPLKPKASWSKALGREKHIDKAVDRLTKEEVEQIDELKKSTLGSYVKKASGNMAGNAAVAAAQASSSMKKSSPEVKRNMVNRMKGIAKASDKLAKESVEEATHNPGVASPRGEGLSPNAKKELARTSPMPDAMNEPKLDKKTFDTIRTSGKTATKRSNDNSNGDKNIINKPLDITARASKKEDDGFKDA